jgi:thiosulfate/3-mercaptopyruvate sulfurtransferase
MSPLISAAELQALMAQKEPLLILDWRFDLSDPHAGRRAYAQGHVPGAHYLTLDEACGPKQLPDGRFQGRHPLPEREDFARLLASMGWQPGLRVVCLDAGNSMFAARGWWMIQWLGEESVQVLDGGMAAWATNGGSLSNALPAVPFAAEAPSLQAPRVKTLSARELRLKLGRCRVVDARAPERFRGEIEPLDSQAGHIPGARNRPFALNLTSENCFKPSAQLRAEWATLRPNQDTVHQCGSGVTACHNLLALAVAELPLGVLYPGSWSEWSADPANPLARH